MKALSLMTVLRRLWNFTQGSRTVLSFAALLIVVAAGLEVVGPYLIKVYIDDYLSEKVVWSTGVLWLVLTYLGALIGASFATWGATIAMNRVSLDVIERLRKAIFAHILRLPLSVLNSTPVGTLVSRITNDTEAVKELFVEVISSFARNTVLLVAVLAAMLMLNWHLALIAVVFIPVTILLMVIYRRISTPIFERSRDLLAKINGDLNESISGMATIRMAGQGPRFAKQFKQLANEQVNVRIKAIHFDGLLLRPMVDLLYVLSLVGVIALFALNSGTSGIAIGVVYASISYLGRFTEPLIDMTMRIKLFQQSVVSAGRVLQWFDEPVEQWPSKAVAAVDASVRLEKVSFSYSGTTNPSLNEVDIHWPHGAWVGIVGHTGSGKSTLISLLQRYYTASQGRILIGGIDILAWPEQQLREWVVPVPQDALLLEGSVKDNIDLGRGYSDEAVMAVLDRCHLGQRIRSLPQGIFTAVSDGGSNFSVGERQLLSLARAILSKPKILILDELTASIDSATEALIEELMFELKGEMTIISIAHRLATVLRTDEIIVLNQGEVMERGQHQTLLQQKGLYHRLYSVQLFEDH